MSEKNKKPILKAYIELMTPNPKNTAAKIKPVDENGKPTIAAQAMYDRYYQWYKEVIDRDIERYKKIEPYKSSLSKQDWDDLHNSMLSRPAVVGYEDGTSDFDKNKYEYEKKISDWVISNLSDFISSQIKAKNKGKVIQGAYSIRG